MCHDTVPDLFESDPWHSKGIQRRCVLGDLVDLLFPEPAMSFKAVTVHAGHVTQSVGHYADPFL